MHGGHLLLLAILGIAGCRFAGAPTISVSLAIAGERMWRREALVSLVFGVVAPWLDRWILPYWGDAMEASIRAEWLRRERGKDQ